MIQSDRAAPIMFDNGILQRLTTGTTDTAFLTSVEAEMGKRLPSFPDTLFCGTPSQVLEYLGIVPSNIPRPQSSSIDPDMPISDRVASILNKTIQHYENVIDMRLLNSRAIEQRRYIGNRPFSVDVFANLIDRSLSDPSFHGNLASALAFHYIAGLEPTSFGKLSSSALSNVRVAPGESPKTRFRWAISQTICLFMIKQRAEGKVSPIGRSLAKVALEILHDNILVVVNGQKKELKSVINFRALEDSLDVELIDSALLGFPSIPQPLTCVTSDSPEQVYCRLIIYKRLLLDFLEKLDHDDTLGPSPVSTNFGRIIVFNTIGEAVADIDVSECSDPPVNLELPEHLLNFAI